jgi:hypothetical protein
MIIETPYKQNDTVTLRTIAGDEVVARFVEENNSTITVTKPLAVVVTQQGLGLGPWTFTVDPQQKIAINKSAIVFVHKTEADMAKQYVSSTSGIQMV